MVLAIPSEIPGGLDAALSQHFGHAPSFTLVEIEGQDVKSVQVLPNGDHVAGGCMAPVMTLKEAGVNALVSGGMGMRPLAGCQQVGIQVFFNEGVATVSEAVRLVVQGQARVFGPAQVCGGGGNCGHH